MGIKFKDMKPDTNRVRAIPVIESGGITPDHKHEIWKSPTSANRGGNPTCWLIEMAEGAHYQELVAVIEMAPGIDMRFVHRDGFGITGVEFVDQNGRIIETADLAEDYQGLKHTCEYQHIVIDPVTGENEAQYVKVSAFPIIKRDSGKAKGGHKLSIPANAVEWYVI